MLRGEFAWPEIIYRCIDSSCFVAQRLRIAFERRRSQNMNIREVKNVRRCQSVRVQNIMYGSTGLGAVLAYQGPRFCGGLGEALAI